MMQLRMPMYRDRGQMTAQQADDFAKQRLAWQMKRREAQTEMQEAIMADSRTDWRQLVSFPGNLSRLSEELLGTNESWQRLSLLQPTQLDRDNFTSRWMGPQYPWYWSGGVLLGLSAASLLILNFSVKSMDRLK
jgi:hypothetical protein